MACLSFHYRTLEDTMGMLKGFSCIVLILVMEDGIAATIIQDTFNNIESGENIRGIIVAETKARTLKECAFR